jgi:imidazolonepropionase-like amidohydrolase
MKILLGAVCLLLIGSAQTKPATMAIRGVTVVNVTDGSLRAEQTVLITGNRIVAVGAADEVTIPQEAEVIDGARGFLIPGLWDMHVHSVANVAWDMRVSSVTTADWHFPMFLAHGVTGVRNMGDATADPALELTTSVKRRLAEGKVRGPRFIAGGPAIDGDPALTSNPVVVRTAAEARAVVDKLTDHDADFIKVYETLSREAYFAILDQAQRRGIPVDGHVPFRVLPKEAAAAGQRTFEHLLAMALGCSTRAEAEREEFARVLSGAGPSAVTEQTPLALFRHERRLYDSRDPAACTETIAAYRKHEVAEAPSLVGYHHVVHAKEILSDTSSMRFVPLAIRRNWETRVDSEMGRTIQSVLRPIVPLQAGNVRLLNDAGVMLLAATDVGIPTLVPGISLHQELVLLVEAGLTPLEAIRAATVNPAHVLGLADSLGTIEAGKIADLVLLEANPLADISNTQRIRAVVADGRLYRRADLDKFLADVLALNQEVEK